MQKPKLLGRKARIQGGDSGDIAAGPIEARDEAGLDRVDAVEKVSKMKLWNWKLK
jgi:hypothetical protein